WERGVSSPNNERLSRIAELGNISMFYLKTGEKSLSDFTDKEIRQAFQGAQKSFTKIKDNTQANIKRDIDELLNNELGYVETMYLMNMLNFLKYSNPQDINRISNIINSLIRYDQYKNADDTNKEELNEFLENEFNDIVSFFHEYIFRGID